MAELDRVRTLGYAIDDQENEIEGRCIGAPVLGFDTQVVAALSISAPVFRMDIARAKSFVPKLKQACTLISAAVKKTAASI
jgi:DNA-binding IclR family transcriptional regulator